MMRILFAASAAAFVLTGCLKAKDTGCRFDECAVIAPASEVTAVENYLASNNITNATKHCSGAYYRVLQQGGGATPNGCSTVNATYAGYLTNGNRFDSATATFPLGQVIRGWTALLPKVNSGGRIQLFIPPTLGYGAQAVGSGSNSIPANSILVFNITVNDVQ
ncbi:FKBP-type peptidylprolyl isomerase [Flaviaesturariibacter flavus]|uniref:Peptidyl-prolyl cis-trans isomerase n=1 Tax=Flaviaesturariibacter flavus TaxID=2502780 RepID=A0A4R1BJM0_9BACT|nr:FKBP-type peptidyl-prolyl cis-trans isomerase [Flaviaesturariibacter flavus]TCJ17447.1 FKBP-type peptidylprolyl isomerase [Flaviaesturariibacter flavus]